MTDHPQVQVRRLIEADAPLFREIRLEALKLSPEAFGSSFEPGGHAIAGSVRRDSADVGRLRCLPRRRSRRHGRLPRASRRKAGSQGLSLGHVRSARGARRRASGDNSSRRSSPMRANGSSSSNWLRLRRRSAFHGQPTRPRRSAAERRPGTVSLRRRRIPGCGRSSRARRPGRSGQAQCPHLHIPLPRASFCDDHARRRPASVSVTYGVQGNFSPPIVEAHLASRRASTMCGGVVAMRALRFARGALH